MSETPWTPGPWEIEPDELGFPPSIVSSEPPNYVLAEILNGIVKNYEANARLIAAAPEMAKLLDRFANSGEDLNVLIDEARDILERIKETQS